MTATAALLAMAAVGLLSLMAGEAECLELPSRRNNVGGGVGGKVRKGTHEHHTLPLHSPGEIESYSGGEGSQVGRGREGGRCRRECRAETSKLCGSERCSQFAHAPNANKNQRTMPSPRSDDCSSPRLHMRAAYISQMWARVGENLNRV